MSTSLVFGPDGRVHGLYTEAIDLNQLGRLHVRRATSIEYSNEMQLWHVRNLHGVVLYSNPSRQQCLSWESGHVGDAGMPKLSPVDGDETHRTTPEDLCQPR